MQFQGTKCRMREAIISGIEQSREVRGSNSEESVRTGIIKTGWDMARQDGPALGRG